MFSQLELPHHHDRAFEDFMLRGIDFRTNRLIELKREKKEPKFKNKNQYYLEMANKKYFYGFYESALKYYSFVLRENPRQIDAWIGQTRVLIDLGKSEAAVFWAEKALNQLPNSDNIELVKAYALAYAGNIEQAKKLINKPVKKNELPMSWLFRGEILIKIKLGFFQKLIKPYQGIGKIGAFFCFLKALEANPKDGLINQRIGIAYLGTNNTSLAYDHLKSSLIADPQNPLTLYCLAECYRKVGNYQYAIYYAKKAITFNPKLNAAIELLQWLHSPYGKFINKVRKII